MKHDSLVVPDFHVFFHLPKTAGRTLTSNFRLNFPARHWLQFSPVISNWKRDAVCRAIDEELARYETNNARCAWSHWAYLGVHEKIRPDAQARYITFLREPVERFVRFAREHPRVFEQHQLVVLPVVVLPVGSIFEKDARRFAACGPIEHEHRSQPVPLRAGRVDGAAR